MVLFLQLALFVVCFSLRNIVKYLHICSTYFSYYYPLVHIFSLQHFSPSIWFSFFLFVNCLFLHLLFICLYLFIWFDFSVPQSLVPPASASFHPPVPHFVHLSFTPSTSPSLRPPLLHSVNLSFTLSTCPPLCPSFGLYVLYHFNWSCPFL